MSINSNVTDNNQDWNTARLIELSDHLGKANNLGLNSAKSKYQADVWTTEKLINMSRHLSAAYGVFF